MSNYTPETLRELAARQTYGEPDGPKLRSSICSHADAWEAERTEDRQFVVALLRAISAFDATTDWGDADDDTLVEQLTPYEVLGALRKRLEEAVLLLREVRTASWVLGDRQWQIRANRLTGVGNALPPSESEP